MPAAEKTISEAFAAALALEGNKLKKNRALIFKTKPRGRKRRGVVVAFVFGLIQFAERGFGSWNVLVHSDFKKNAGSCFPGTRRPPGGS